MRQVPRYRALVKTVTPDAVFDSSAKLVHAEGAAKSVSARAALKRAVVAVENAKTRKGRKDQDASLSAWQGLVAARWSVVDQFESDGRRYVVARENEPAAPPLESLSKRERQIVGYVALGHSSKLIAYELGLADSTVRVLLHRAMRKLGVHDQRSLAAVFMRQMARGQTEPGS